MSSELQNVENSTERRPIPRFVWVAVGVAGTLLVGAGVADYRHTVPWPEDPVFEHGERIHAAWWASRSFNFGWGTSIKLGQGSTLYLHRSESGARVAQLHEGSVTVWDTDPRQPWLLYVGPELVGVCANKWSASANRYETRIDVEGRGRLFADTDGRPATLEESLALRARPTPPITFSEQAGPLFECQQRVSVMVVPDYPDSDLVQVVRTN